jgi:GTP cyclohydrolase FolE2
MTDITALKPRRQHTHSEVEDVQGHADTRRIPINRVGIKDISHPVKVKDRSEGEQHTIATFNMYVNLPHNFKGTHMSRFVEILHGEREISVESFRAMLEKMTARLEACGCLPTRAWRRKARVTPCLRARAAQRCRCWPLQRWP